MIDIPDAPYIRAAERYGRDYVHSFMFGNDDEPEAEYPDEPFAIYDPD